MKLLSALLALGLAFAFTTGASAGERYGKQKVVYHINYNGGDADKRYRGAMRSIQNHINAVGTDNLEVKVVLHGNGVALLASAKNNQRLQSAVTRLKTQNVSFHVCNNTLRGRKISYEDDLFEVQQTEVEDLLAAALNLDVQESYLDVHYRSRNAHLIEFSNEYFYKGRLPAIPGHPNRHARFAPLTLHRADSVYEARVNPGEAERVVQLVDDLLKRAAPPSIGIACFNLAQRDLIAEALDDRAMEDDAFARRFQEVMDKHNKADYVGQS